MQNETTRLKRAKNVVPPNKNERVPLKYQRVRNEEHRPSTPRVSNPNVMVLENIVEEEIFENCDQEANITQDEILESVQMDEGTSSFYIFYEQEDIDISQENGVQTREQVNKFKTKEAPKKQKT
jgi:hypothetical protein